MESTINDLISRRSTRMFKEEMLPDNILNKILEVETYAPTGRGFQSPKIIAIKNKEVRNELSKLNASIMGSQNDPFYGAPVVVIVLADKNIGTYLEDGSLVIGNMLNVANALGIGSCWIHRAKEEFETEIGKELLKKWNIPENYVGIGHCILGYKLQEDLVAKPRKEDYITIIE